MKFYFLTGPGGFHIRRMGPGQVCSFISLKSKGLKELLVSRNVSKDEDLAITSSKHNLGFSGMMYF